MGIGRHVVPVYVSSDNAGAVRQELEFVVGDHDVAGLMAWVQARVQTDLMRVLMAALGSIGTLVVTRRLWSVE